MMLSRHSIPISPPTSGSSSAADRYISQLKCQHPSIRSISLAGNDITMENVAEFTMALVNNGTVTYLSLVCLRGGMTSKGSTLLAASAMSLTTLKTFAWSNVCEDRSYAVQILSRGLSTSRSLNRVLLMNSKFDNRDIECIAEGLSRNVRIDTMGLEACGVTDLGALALSKMLKRNRVLRTLCLEENVITDVGANALMSSIYDSSSLSSIWESNHILRSFWRSAPSSPDEYGMDKFYHVSRDMKRQISEILEINRIEKCPMRAGRRKIASHMERNFNLSWTQEIPYKAIPNILHWCGPTARFEFLRNMPELFASPRRTSPLGQCQSRGISKPQVGKKRIMAARPCRSWMNRGVLRSAWKWKTKKKKKEAEFAAGCSKSKAGAGWSIPKVMKRKRPKAGRSW